MLFNDKVASRSDEVSWGSDSSMATRGLFRIDTGSYVQGSLGNGDTEDYYLVEPPSGHFNLFVTAEGLNPSPVTRGSFKIEIVDTNGITLVPEQWSSPDIQTEQIAMRTVWGDHKYYLKISSASDVNYQVSMYPVDIGPPPALADDPETGERREDWRLETTDGFSGSIGGAFGQVFGTNGFQSISVLDVPGSVRFDPSFNRGGDIVSLEGIGDNSIANNIGSSASVSFGHASVVIPAGPAGLVLDFEDGSRLLRLEERNGFNQLIIGDHNYLTDDTVSVGVGPAQDIELPDGFDHEAVARLFVADAGTVVAKGNLEIFGTLGGQEITLQPSVATLDPSFNRGGDALFLEGDFSDFEALVLGSSVLIEGDGYAVEIPVGTVGMQLVFSDAAATLFYDFELGSFFIGEQVIGEVAAPLSFA